MTSEPQLQTRLNLLDEMRRINERLALPVLDAAERQRLMAELELKQLEINRETGVALLARLRSAKGPDRTLDGDIAVALRCCFPTARPSYSSEILELDPARWEHRGNGYLAHPDWRYDSYQPVASSREFTGTIDAACALAESLYDKSTALAIVKQAIDTIAENPELPLSDMPRIICAAILQHRTGE
jgi:hypothetical protein